MQVGLSSKAMNFSFQSRSSEPPSTGESPDFIDIKEFSNRCDIFKNEIKQNKYDTLVLEPNLENATEEPTSSPLVNPNLVAKWQNIFERYSQNYEDTNLMELIASEDANLNSETARKEAELARRIARCKLFAAEALKNEAAQTSNSKFNKNNNNSLPISNNATISSAPGNVIETNFISTPVSPGDVVLTLSVFPGGKSSSFQSAHRQEMEIKASDSLETFTEGIYCLSRRIANDIITDSSRRALIKSSSFLFIEGTFYDEELDGESHSRPSDIYYESFKAVGSASLTARFICNDPTSVKQASLKSTKWIDLKVRLNTPYLFAHLGGCEHVFFISQIRAVCASEENNLLLPRMSQALRVRRRKCRICEVYASTKMLINDKLLPENPCVICDKCFEGFHGTGQKWYSDFEITPYYHEA